MVSQIHCIEPVEEGPRCFDKLRTLSLKLCLCSCLLIICLLNISIQTLSVRSENYLKKLCFDT